MFSTNLLSTLLADVLVYSKFRVENISYFPAVEHQWVSRIM